MPKRGKKRKPKKATKKGGQKLGGMSWKTGGETNDLNREKGPGKHTSELITSGTKREETIDKDGRKKAARARTWAGKNLGNWKCCKAKTQKDPGAKHQE